MKRLWVLCFVLVTLVLWSPMQAEQNSLTAQTACPGPPQNANSAGCFIYKVNGAATVGLQINGTFTGTISFEYTVDTLTWVAWPVLPTGSTTAVSSTTTAGLWQGDTRGIVLVRMRVSAAWTGSALVTTARYIG